MDAVANIQGWKRLKFVRLRVPAERAERCAVFGVVALGIWLRARGYLFSTEALWLDEAMWARRLIEDPLLEHLSRPIGFMALSKALVSVFSPSETVLRALPWAAGMATTLLAPLLARRLFHSAAARLLFIAILALDPAAIDLAKEFKPYSVSLALHVGLLLTVLGYRDSRRARELVWVLLLAVPGVLFAQDALFAYPGVFLVLGVDALRSKKWRHLAALAAAAIATVGVIGSLYFFVWSRMDRSADEAFWAKKYDVFFVAPKKGAGDQIGWLSNHYAEMAETAGARNAHWTSERWTKRTVTDMLALDKLIWLVLHVAGLTVIVRGRLFREGLLLMMPLSVMLVFNMMGRWPFGAFRANLFVLVYFAAIAAIAIDRRATKVRWGDLLPTLVLVILPLFAFERTWHATKGTSDMTMTSRFPDAMKAAIDLQGRAYRGPREALVTDNYGCAVWNFYIEYHPTISKTLAPELKRRFDHRCRRLAPEVLREVRRELKDNGGRVWIIATDQIVIRDFDRKWPADLVKTEISRIGEDTHLVLGVTKAPEVEPAEPL